MADEDCRCGRAKADQEADHLCHGQGYTCPRVGKVKFYVPGPFSLSGQALKLSVTKTWACTRCWHTWQARQLSAARGMDAKTWYAGRATRD